MATYNWDSIDEINTVYKERKCVRCNEDILETPHWIMGSPPAGVNACVECPNCATTYSVNKHSLSDVDTDEFLSMSEKRKQRNK